MQTPRNGCPHPPIAASIAALVLIVLAAGCGDPSAVVDPNDSAIEVFEVPKGSSGQRVGKLLEKRGLTTSAFNWKMVLRSHDGSCIKAGRHNIRRNMTVVEIIEALCAAPIADEVPFTVLEGWRIKDIDRALANLKYIKSGEYTRVATNKAVKTPFSIKSPTLEGYLYPETYMVPRDKKEFRVETLIARQLSTFKERFLDAHQKNFGKRTLHQLVVVASMIEREEPTPKYRPIVAGIIYNRLDKNTPLGIDATSRYKLVNWEDERAFRAVLKDPNDEYGTRVRGGLPPTAIGNPTQTALEAAVYPAKTEFWYYLHDKNGVFHGGRNGAEHEANRAKYSVY